MRYPFIAIEGVDGTGKTTLRKSLFQLLDSAYSATPLAVLTINFLDDRVAAAIVAGKYQPTADNRAAFESALRADKRRTTAGVIEPSLPVRPVIADRWLATDLTFFAVKHGIAPAESYGRLADDEVACPDLTLVLELGTEFSMARASGRPGESTRADWDVLDVQTRLAAAYADIMTAAPDLPALGRQVVRLDASRSRAELLYDAWSAIVAHTTLDWPDQLPRAAGR